MNTPDLATVEQWLRESAAESDPDSTALRVLLAEYDRRGEVIEAMRALIVDTQRQRDEARAQLRSNCEQGHDVTRISCEDAAAVRAKQRRALEDGS